MFCYSYFVVSRPKLAHAFSYITAYCKLCDNNRRNQVIKKIINLLFDVHIAFSAAGVKHGRIRNFESFRNIYLQNFGSPVIFILLFLAFFVLLFWLFSFYFLLIIII